jgi:hypothetical protein
VTRSQQRADELGREAMAKEGKSDEEKVESKDASERQLRTRAKKALKKADRFWRLAEGVPSKFSKSSA